jgi:hypothetical protein
MKHDTGVPSTTTHVTVKGVGHMLHVTPQRVHQMIADEEIPPPTIKLNERQRVYTLDEAIEIWKNRATEGLVVDLKVSSNQSR